MKTIKTFDVTYQTTSESHRQIRLSLKELEDTTKKWKERQDMYAYGINADELDDIFDDILDDIDDFGTGIVFTPDDNIFEEKDPEPVIFPTMDEFITKSEQVFFDRKEYDSDTFIYRKDGMIVGYINDIRDDRELEHEYISILLKKPVKYFNDFDDNEDTICDYKPISILKEAEEELINLYVKYYLY